VRSTKAIEACLGDFNPRRKVGLLIVDDSNR
jgi:hypothetical protein